MVSPPSGSIKALGPRRGGRKYTLISRKVNEPVDKDVFAFRAPEGFTSVDHSVTPVRIQWPDGRVEFQDNKQPPMEVSTPPKANGVFWIILLANLLILCGFVLFVFILRRRARQNENG